MRANPILPGFNPDPSICRVGDDYYIATSTFEWFPGVQIHHSRDLSNWRLLTRPLNRASQLDMRGNPDSGGIWSADLSHAHGRFWLVYTNMTRHHGTVKDGITYLVTAPAIYGPWSDPVLLNASGFDPSLFHDDDGRSWLLQVQSDHDPQLNLIAGISAQEFDRASARLVGERHLIFTRNDMDLTEWPHLYKRHGWYHLLTAEGGIGHDHACIWARSRTLLGPYEVHPQKHILTARGHPDHTVQNTGHGDIVETPDGRVFLVHAMHRTIGGKRCILGQETGIQECEWRDDWLSPKGGPLPAASVDLPDAPAPVRLDYDFSDGLPADFQWQRTPYPERLFQITDGALILTGRESIASWHEQALVARRQTEFTYRAETSVDFAPADEQEMAGLTAYHSRHAHYALVVAADKTGHRMLRILAAGANSGGGTWSYPGDPVKLEAGPVRLAVVVDHEALQFHWAQGDAPFQPIGPVLDATILSDEAIGTFVGLCAMDMNGNGKAARFAHFSYTPDGTT